MDKKVLIAIGVIIFLVIAFVLYKRNKVSSGTQPGESLATVAQRITGTWQGMWGSDLVRLEVSPNITRSTLNVRKYLVDTNGTIISQFPLAPTMQMYQILPGVITTDDNTKYSASGDVLTVEEYQGATYTFTKVISV